MTIPDGVLGVISERDVVRAFINEDMKFFNRTVDSMMTPSSKFIVCNMDTDVNTMIDSMLQNNVRHLGVLEAAGTMKAFVSIKDVIAAAKTHYKFSHLADDNSQELSIKELHDYVLDTMELDLNHKEIEKVFRHIDKNGDGTVEVHEFLEAVPSNMDFAEWIHEIAESAQPDKENRL